jgi:hypothetical protein
MKKLITCIKIGYIWLKRKNLINKKGLMHVLFGLFVFGGLSFLSSSAIVIGIINKNPLASGIGCLISLVLFFTACVPVGFFRRIFGRQVFPTIIKVVSFWIVVIGLLSMTIPSIFAEAIATATLAQKLTVITLAVLITALLALYSWATGKSPIAWMTFSVIVMICLSLLTIIRFTAKDWFDSEVAMIYSHSKQRTANNNEAAGKGKTVGRTFLASTKCLYKVDSVTAGKTTTYTATQKPIIVKRGQKVQVLNSAKPIIVDETALLKIVLPNSMTDKFLCGQIYWVEASLLSSEEAEIIPGQYAVAKTQSNLWNKIGWGGKETRRIVFDADRIVVEDLPVGKNYTFSGGAYKDIAFRDPKTGKLAYYMFGFDYGNCPASLEMFGKKGTVVFLSFS